LFNLLFARENIARLAELKAPGIIERQSVFEVLATGVLSIDSIIPIGRGQRELVIGDRAIGKTSIGLDAIANQTNYNFGQCLLKDILFCVYIATGQKRVAVINLVARLEAQLALAYTIIIAATASDSATSQFVSPYAGCAVSEFFRDNGMHVLTVYDDLSKQAVGYRQIALLLRRPPGREAYPGDVFYLHSRLLERAAKMHKYFGGGTLTGVPVIETQSGDVSAYIPTNVISITDGQIFLDSILFYLGQRPSVGVGLSVSRVGSAAQSKIIRKLSKGLRFVVTQYRDIAIFLSFSSDAIDDLLIEILVRGSIIVQAITQDVFGFINFIQEYTIIYNSTAGGLDQYFTPELFTVKKIQSAIVDNTKINDSIYNMGKVLDAVINKNYKN
jgi:proton translocating ATP synthase F1 alpha subunit